MNRGRWTEDEVRQIEAEKDEVQSPPSTADQLRDLIAENQRLLAAIERVRALADDIAYCWDDENTTVEVVVAAILRALDGGR